MLTTRRTIKEFERNLPLDYIQWDIRVNAFRKVFPIRSRRGNVERTAMRKNPTPDLNPGIEERRFTAWRAFIQAHGVLTWLMSRELDEGLGLPLVWYEILLYVNDAKDGVIPMAQLEDRITFSQSGLSQLLTRVENAGLIERRRDSSDGRRQMIAISEAGRDVLSAAARIHKKTIEDHFATLVDDREAVVIGRAFERILEAGRAKRESSRVRASASKNFKGRRPA